MNRIPGSDSRFRTARPTRSHRRIIGAAALFTVVAATLTACGGAGADGRIATDSIGSTGPTGDAEWQQVIEDAKAEGTVTIYSSNTTEQLTELASRFQNEYGIRVDVVRDVDANLHQKIGAELTTGNMVADVVLQATPAWSEQLGSAGNLTAPVGPAVTESEYDAAALLRPGHDFVTNASVGTFAWNTDRLPEGLTGYEDLLDPALAGGKIGTVLPTSAAHIDLYENYLDEVGGADYMERLAAQKPRIYPGAQPLAQALASGEIAAATFVQDQTKEAEAGAPVASGFDDTVWGGPMYAGILTDAPHPAAAQLLANYLVTPAGQEAISFRAASVLPGIASAVITIDKVAPQDTAAMTPEALEALKTRFNQLFN
ncbi:ABC transporter substrate-binding protein [Rhodococcus triatomae]